MQKRFLIIGCALFVIGFCLMVVRKQRIKLDRERSTPIVTCGKLDSRVVRIFEEVKTKAGVIEEIPVCSEPTLPHGQIVIYLGVFTEMTYGKLVVRIGKEYTRINSDDSLRSIFAHEFGHIILGHLHAKAGGLTKEQESKLQVVADAYAIKLVGRETYKQRLRGAEYEESDVNRELAVIEAYLKKSHDTLSP